MRYNGQSMDVFYVDNNGNVAAVYNTGPSWQGPVTIAANVATAGGATALATEQSSLLDLFFIQNGLGVSESRWNGSSWSSTVLLP